MTTTQVEHRMTGSDWRQLNRLIDARERVLLDYTRAVREQGVSADSGPYEAAIRELRAWMDEHTDWGAE